MEQPRRSARARIRLLAISTRGQRLKIAFLRLAICVVGDALCACEAVFDLCQQYDWKFVFTLKEGSHPAAFAEAADLLPSAKQTTEQPTTTCSCNSPTPSPNSCSKPGSGAKRRFMWRC